MRSIGRRQALKLLGAAAAGLFTAGCGDDTSSGTGRRVIVVGGGFGGTVAAKYLRMLAPDLEVTLIERNREHVCCPFSNYVLVGERPLGDLTFSVEDLCSRHGIRFIPGEVTGIDPRRRKVTVDDGVYLGYDRLILSPGIRFRSEAIDGYRPSSTPLSMPHAWIAGDQTLLLKKQIEAMPDGGTVLISIPPAPFRCPSGPYERASLIAETLSRSKPRSKLVVLDANPNILSLEAHFQKVWMERFPGMIEYLPGETVVRLEEVSKTLYTKSGGKIAADVVNLIPPQRAGHIADKARLVAEGGGWCPIDPDTFESRLQPGIHVIGDSAQAGAMPKSGYSANGQAKACAMNVAALMTGGNLIAFSAINVCYIGLSLSQTASFAAVYTSKGGEIVTISGAGGVSPLDLGNARQERVDAESWLRNILAEMSA